MSSYENPADIASRGCSVNEIGSKFVWWHGPKFLWESANLEMNVETYDVDINDPELKRVLVTNTHEYFSLVERLDRFSDWFKTKKAVALILRFVKKCKSKTLVCTNNVGVNKSIPPVSVDELVEAEMIIIKHVQHKHFEEELTVLTDTKNNGVKKSSSLYKLDPFIDENGLLRVGGRICKGEFDDCVKHPVVLPNKGHITELIICHHHKKVKHQGRNITLNEIRASGYWIVGGSSLVANHIFKCVTCKKVRGSGLIQKMADLPKDRLETVPPFTYSAVDYFGPFFIKEGRKELKRYGVLFTCMSTRAVHLETANSLSTDSFLNAYRRFVCRRGPVRQMRSDQGTNFVGAKGELKESLNEMDNDVIRNELLRRNCDWIIQKMNVPYASHMGGVWERQIRSVRNILCVLFSQHGRILDDESLRTFITEAESIVNGRPLSVENLNSPLALEPLTPNHILTMKSRVLLPPPGKFVKNDQFCRKQWRRVQYLTNEF